MRRALLLDLDGTVADTQELIYRCYNDTLRQHLGREGVREVWKSSIGLPLEAMFAAALEYYGVREPSPELLARSYRARLTEIDEGVTSFPGVEEALQALRSGGIRLALVTSKHQPAVARHLGLIKLTDMFEVVVTGDQCVRCKPDPEPFSRALEALDVSPAQAAGVGDSVSDLVSARAAGVLAVAACWGAVDRFALLSANPDRVLEEPHDLLGFLR